MYRTKREVDEKIFLADCWTRYTKLIETSYVLKKKVEDKLILLSSVSSIPNIENSTELFVDTSSDDSGTP